MQDYRQSHPTSTGDFVAEHQERIVCMYLKSLVERANLTDDDILPAQKLDKLLMKLDPLDCSRKHQTTSETRQSGTCQWLFATDAYKEWREGTGTFLWLQGKRMSFN